MAGLFRWLARRSLRFLHALGALLGWMAYLGSREYRQLLRTNAQRAGLDGAQIRAAVAEAGKLVAEVPWLWIGSGSQPISRHVRWHGDALIDEALAAGRGLVLLTPHLGSFEVCAQAYAERWGARHPLTVLYRPARQPWLREFAEQSRRRPGLETAPTSLAGVRQMLRALRRGEAVGLLPDQVPPRDQGVWVPFFGAPAYTMTLAARLVLTSGAPWLLAWAERLPRAGGWVLRVQRPTRPLPAAGDDEAGLAAVTAAMNAEMERVVLECPTQYLWAYDRYKTPRRPRRVAAAS